MNNTSSVNASTNTDHVPDPQEAMLTYYKQSKRTLMDLTVASRGAYLAWGVAWLIGFGALWISQRSTSGAPSVWAFIVFTTVLVAAWVVSAVVGIRSGRSVQGNSSFSGAIYGWAWVLSFSAGIFMVAWFCKTYTITPAISGMLYTAVSALIAGTLYIAGAAIWQDRSMLVIGSWMLALTVWGIVVGLPQAYLVMALAGGGGMLVAFAHETWSIHRRTARAARGADHD